jgi:hypothetical protein
MGQKEDLRRRYELLNPIELCENIKWQKLKLIRCKQQVGDLEMVPKLNERH